MSHCSVIVVEDDRELGELVLEALGMELDCELRLILDGREAVEWFSSEEARDSPPDLVILDMHLPSVSGMEILDFIRSRETFHNTQIIVTTADSMLLERARDKADWLLLKPVAYSHITEISRWFKARLEKAADTESSRNPTRDR
ncbi:MAG: response regulator [Proteobacteria bacterium]|nr:MAG: response regulator [Pseudomonadota bacterium]